MRKIKNYQKDAKKIRFWFSRLFAVKIALACLMCILLISIRRSASGIKCFQSYNRYMKKAFIYFREFEESKQNFYRLRRRFG